MKYKKQLISVMNILNGNVLWFIKMIFITQIKTLEKLMVYRRRMSRIPVKKAKLGFNVSNKLPV